MSGTRAISTIWRRELSSSFFFSLQGKAPKEIHAILTEILACFLPGRAKDLSAPLYVPVLGSLSSTQSECTLSHILSRHVPLYQKYINDSERKEDKGRRRRIQRCRTEVVKVS